MNIRTYLNLEPTVENSIGLLEEFNKRLESAETGDEWREIRREFSRAIEDYIETACLSSTGSFDWEAALTLTEPYQPCTVECSVISTAANLICRGIVRTRVEEGVSAIPPEALHYIRSITWGVDTEAAATLRGVHAWGIGHPTVAVDKYLRTRAGSGDELHMMSAVDHMFLADQEAALEIVEHWCTDTHRKRFDDEEIIGPLYSLGKVVKASNGEEVVQGANIGSWDYFEEIKRDFTLDDSIGNRIDEISTLDYSVTDEYTTVRPM